MKTQVVAILLQASGRPVLIGHTPPPPEEVQSCSIEVEAGAGATEQAAACRAAANEAKWVIRRPLLALPSQTCLAATIVTDGLHRSQRAAGMLYRLEEYLPLDAEHLTADFIGSPHHALGVAVQTDTIQAITEAFESEGITFSAIVPGAMLALQAAIARHDLDGGPVVLLGHHRFDLFELRDGHILRWVQGPAEENALARAVACGHLDNTTSKLWWSADGDTGLDLLVTCWPQDRMERICASPRSLMGHAALQVAGHGHAPLIDLQRGPLASKNRLERIKTPFYSAVAALILLLTTICVSNLWRSQHLASAIVASQDEQQRMYREAFPGQNVPPAVLARLRSEQQRLAGLSGQSDQLPAWHSSLSLLEQVLSALPPSLPGALPGGLPGAGALPGGAEVRYRILELRLDQDGVYIDGQARSHGDADKIATNLRSSGGFAIQPPRTQNLADRGVAFTLIGRLDARTLAEGSGR